MGGNSELCIYLLRLLTAVWFVEGDGPGPGVGHRLLSSHHPLTAHVHRPWRHLGNSAYHIYKHNTSHLQLQHTISIVTKHHIYMHNTPYLQSKYTASNNHNTPDLQIRTITLVYCRIRNVTDLTSKWSASHLVLIQLGSNNTGVSVSIHSNCWKSISSLIWSKMFKEFMSEISLK